MDWLGITLTREIGVGTLGLIALIVGAIVVWWIRGMPERRASLTSAEAQLRVDLMRRIDELQKEVQAERVAREADRKACDEEIKLLEERITAITRQFVAYQLAQARAIPLENHPEIENALQVLEQISRRRDRKEEK